MQLTPPTKKTFELSGIIATIGLLGAPYNPWIAVVGLFIAYLHLLVGVTKKGW